MLRLTSLTYGENADFFDEILVQDTLEGTADTLEELEAAADFSQWSDVASAFGRNNHNTDYRTRVAETAAAAAAAAAAAKLPECQTE